MAPFSPETRGNLGKALTDPVWFFITDWLAIFWPPKALPSSEQFGRNGQRIERHRDDRGPPF